MYQIPQDKLAYFNKQINNYNRKITYRLTLNDKSLPIDKVMDNLVITTDSGLNQYGVGSALVAQLQMSVKKEVRIIPKDKIKVEIGLEIFNEVSQQWETIYSPLGVFYVDTIEETGIVKKLKAYDGMYKLNKGYFPTAKHTTTQAIANDIAQANGYKVKGVSNVTINNEQLEGKNANEMLSLVASAMGTNVRISRSGDTIEFVEPIATNLTFNENHLSTATLDDTTSYNITKLRVNYSDQVTNDEGAVTDEGYFTVGSGTDANTLELNNPLLKGQQAQANSVLTTIKKLNGYKRFDTTMPLADFRLEPMDMVTYSKGGVNYLVPILYSKMVLSYQGVSIETQSPTLAPTKSEFSFKGTLTQKVENIYSDIIQVKQLTANKVTTDELEVTVATIEQLYAKKAEINELVAGTIIVESLKAQVAEIDKLVANKADINQLTALNATINSLKAQVAEIDNLIAGSIISEIIQSGSISSDLLNIKDGFIKDAMIGSLSASKIDSGVINTNNVLITSDNGNMTLQGNLLQFKDKSGKVRIQIGQDTKGNYTFTLYDSTGKGVLINEQGIQSSNAIKDGLIVDAKVANNANISGSKLNISSLYDSMNADNSKTLKASKVHLDDKNQTLDVSFKEMTAKQDSMENTMNTAITDISVSKGQISQLIQDTTITTANGTTKLKDAYNTTKSTVDSHTTTIGNMQSTINSHTGEIQSVKSETASVKAGLGKIELDVKTNYETKSEVDKKINGIQIGTRNFLKYSDLSESLAKSSISVRGTTHVVTIDGTTKYMNKNTLKIVASASGNNSGEDVLWTSVLGYTQGTGTGRNLLFSFYAKANKNTRLKARLGHGNYKTNAYADITTTWQRYVMDISEIANTRLNGEIIFHLTSAGTVWLTMAQLEDGTKPSDWSPAPEDVDASITSAKNETKSYTDSKIQLAKNEIDLSVKTLYETKTEVTTKVNNAINGLQIGARNLVIQSPTLNSQFNPVNTYKGIRTIVDDTSAKSKKHVKFECTTAGTGFHVDVWRGDNSYVGKQFTWSFYAKMNKSKKLSNVGHERGGMTSIDVTTEWKKFTHTWTYARGNWSFVFYPNFEVGDILYIKDLQIEEGNKATDWSPAPEDIDDSITNTKNEVKQYTDSQIQIAKNAITQSVSSTYETKTEVTNKINGIHLGTRNFALKSNKEFTNNDYLISWYSTSELFKIGEEYTVTLCVTPAKGVSYYGLYVSSGWKYLAPLNVSGTSKQIVSTTFRFDGYHADKTPTSPTHGDAHYNVYRFPNNNTVTGKSTIHWIKVEKGNKPSDFTPAPEDGELQITELTTRVSKAEQKITDSAIIQTVSQVYATKGEVSTTYATKSELTQTSNNLTVKFNNSGNGGNLVANGDFLNGTDCWRLWGGAHYYLGVNPNCNIGARVGANSVGGLVSNQFRIKPNTKYTLSFDGHIEPNVINAYATIEMFDGAGTNRGLACNHPIQRSSQKHIIHLTTGSNVGTDWVAQIAFKHEGTHVANSGYLLVLKNVCLTEGHNSGQFVPATRALYEGIVRADAQGITVTHSADSSYSKMSATGFEYFAHGSGHRYHNLMKQGWIDTINFAGIGASGWGMTVTLPPEFRGKPFSVIPAITYVGCPHVADAIKMFEINIPHNQVNYNNGTFNIYIYASGLWAEGLSTTYSVEVRATWVAIA